MDVCWEDAVRRGDADIVRDLLSRGIDPNVRDRNGQTGLMLAAHEGNLTVVQLLIDHGANLNVTAKFGLSAVMLDVIATQAVGDGLRSWSLRSDSMGDFRSGHSPLD